MAEALSCGLPALLSHGVGVSREVVAAGAVLAETDTVDGVRRLLERWLDLDTAAAGEMRRRAEACFEARFETLAATRRFLATVAEGLDARSPVEGASG